MSTSIKTDTSASATQPSTRQGQAAGLVNESESRSIAPPVDVFENDSSITLIADMPGVPRDQLELQVDGDALTIEGTARPNVPDGLEALWAEVRVPRYRRSFTLSRELDKSKIDAQLKDGVLTLRIQKHAHAQPRRIPVNAG